MAAAGLASIGPTGGMTGKCTSSSVLAVRSPHCCPRPIRRPTRHIGPSGLRKERMWIRLRAATVRPQSSPPVTSTQDRSADVFPGGFSTEVGDHGVAAPACGRDRTRRATPSGVARISTAATVGRGMPGVGPPSRLPFHGVPRTLPGTGDNDIGLRSGRLNITLRESGLE